MYSITLPSISIDTDFMYSFRIPQAPQLSTQTGMFPGYTSID